MQLAQLILVFWLGKAKEYDKRNYYTVVELLH